MGKIFFVAPCLQKGKRRVLFARKLFILLISPDLITENTNENLAILGIQFLKSTVSALNL